MLLVIINPRFKRPNEVDEKREHCVFWFHFPDRPSRLSLLSPSMGCMKRTHPKDFNTSSVRLLQSKAVKIFSPNLMSIDEICSFVWTDFPFLGRLFSTRRKLASEAEGRESINEAVRVYPLHAASEEDTEKQNKSEDQSSLLVCILSVLPLCKEHHLHSL